MPDNIYAVLKDTIQSNDLEQSMHAIGEKRIHFTYCRSIVDQKLIDNEVLHRIQTSNAELDDVHALIRVIPLENTKASSDVDEIVQRLIRGFLFVQLEPDLHEGLLIDVADLKRGYRSNNEADNEYSVIGPKAGFVEDLDTNLNLLRKELVSEHLRFEEYIKGSLSQTRVVIVYVDGICNPDYVDTVRQRIADADFDVVFDSSLIDQVITDNANSPFPLYISTERVDRAKYCLLSGQVAVLSGGSPYVISGPSTVFDFFASPEDYYLPWVLASFFRCIRFMGVAFSILASPFYVAVLTFHYSVIPQELLGPIIESRANVPFPPLIEVLLLEITVDMLREAGARLPTKVGQTLGIVGGVVLGTAAVQAGLTSSILIIVVSLSALSSFVTPIFKMANTIRFLRFPFIALAAAWGGLGITMGFLLLIGHLLRLKSLGAPYLLPMFPFRIRDYADSFIRSPFSMTNYRQRYLRPLKLERYKVSKQKDRSDDYNHE
ncbi:spore germination protein [Paenibacillus glycinis]|uniref:Spore germination protein n=1 Tax=Paenibacillus glycinis TaxID=2697035 RepID=A0ABW9XQJ7_9BACL|nr:spore germination protein [Paenibacillus glycinis]NBD24909.1 spore germination protein [Paenibacillus glycinis]